MCEFEKKVKKSLEDILKSACVTGVPRIGLAVSGGADSVALLLAVSEIIASIGYSGSQALSSFPLYVITVNHNIRPAAESRGDVDFVLEVCEKLRRGASEVGAEPGIFEIVCEAIELERGEVEGEAQKRGGGIEEAARYLRYAAFERFIASHKLDLLCTAHTQNDQLETVLMRFLQGSPVEASVGIKAWRPLAESNCIYARPLLGVTRGEIEAYVNSRGFCWRTDKTNYETDYLRNRIRHNLVPLLDAQFLGWQTALLSGTQKAFEDADFISSCVDDIQLSVTDSAKGLVEIPLQQFVNSHPAIQRRVILSACNKAGEAGRIPNQFIKEIISVIKQTDSFTKHFSAIDIIKEKNHLFVKKHEESNTDLVFSDIIENIGTFEFPFGDLNVFNYREQNGKRFVSVCAGQGGIVDGVSIPFSVRSLASGDTVLCADGTEKKVSDILSDWHVSASKRNLVPVIQLLDEKSQRIIAVLAGFLGYKDWIVKL